jgi:TolB-like protein/Flp pilus assembly protein TadD
VESLSEAGGICISGRAYDQVANKLGLEYENLGEHQVKNISTPIRVYRVLSFPGAAAHRVVQAKEDLGRRWRKIALSIAAVVVAAVVVLGIWQFYTRRPSVEPASVEKMAFPLPDKPSIAVLPFDNMSGDPGQEYFSDGISEEIITSLSSVPELFVIARNSTFTYKGKPVKVQQVSEQLGVRYVLEGSVRRAGDKVRITAQLVDALTGHHLWAESYDRTLEDIFVLQDEITMKIITELQVELTGREGARLRAPCSENLKAYLKYLEALGHFNRYNREDIDVARRLTEEAIVLDSEYACAYSLLAGTYLADVILGASTSPKDSLAKGKKMVDKAIDLNPSLAGPHAVLSWILLKARQHEKAIATAKKALDLDPNSLLARLAPYSTNDFISLGLSYFLIGQYEEAIRACKRATDSNPNHLFAHLCLTSTYSAVGHEEDARAAAAEILRINPRFSVEYLSKMLSFKKADKELFIGNLRKAGLK